MSQTQLESLKQFTTVVADTGDFESIRAYRPQDATTNPSLIYAAVQQAAYKPLLEKAIADAKARVSGDSEILRETLLGLLVAFGEQILQIVPGRVSTEVDARLSFNTDASVAMAREIIARFDKIGVPKERILIKLATTWEGVQAAKILKKDHINCNMTLLFSLAQAVAAAEAGAQLISPFVGRILDWHKTATGKDFSGSDDPGVQSVHAIYHYYKKFGHTTEVMGASFRNTSEILELAGCDLLTISPNLLEELSKTSGPIEQKLDAKKSQSLPTEQLKVDEPAFRWHLNEDPMATEKLAEGIRKFAADTCKLEAEILQKV